MLVRFNLNVLVIYIFYVVNLIMVLMCFLQQYLHRITARYKSFLGAPNRYYSKIRKLKKYEKGFVVSAAGQWYAASIMFFGRFWRLAFGKKSF